MPSRFARPSLLRASWLFAALGFVAAGAGCAANGDPEWVGTSAGELSSCASGTTLKGVDVSSYQGTINWSSARADGITFGFAKATEGETIADSTFAGNWAGMKAAGVVRGAYHFFHPNESATAQADFVLSKVGTLEAGDLPVVLDLKQGFVFGAALGAPCPPDVHQRPASFEQRCVHLLLPVEEIAQ